MNFTNEELITAATSSLKKWESVKQLYIKGTDSRCGFCDLLYKKDISTHGWKECRKHCPAQPICHENLDFWPKNKTDSPKGQKRIQKNIEWLENYIEEWECQ